MLTPCMSFVFGVTISEPRRQSAAEWRIRSNAPGRSLNDLKPNGALMTMIVENPWFPRIVAAGLIGVWTVVFGVLGAVIGVGLALAYLALDRKLIHYD
jgi:hypothetical protein